MARTIRPTKLPGLTGKLPSQTEPQLAAKIDAMAEAIQVRLGLLGDPRDRAVTLRELIESGLAQELAGNKFDPNNPKPGFQPPVVLPNPTTPPKPTGFTATGGYSLIQLYWDFPAYAKHSLTEIYRNDVDVIGNATLIGTSGGTVFIDPTGEDAEYYYWIRHVSTTNTPGPFNATAGTLATTALDVDNLLDTLTGAIRESELATALRETIDNTEILSAALSAFTGYDDSYVGDPLLFLLNAAEGNITALQSTVNNPTTGVAATAAAVSALGATVYNPSSGVAASAANIAALQATVYDPSAGVGASASAISTLNATVYNPTTGLAATASSLTSLTTTVGGNTATIATHASSINGLSAEYMVKVNVNGRVAGFGLYLGTTSDFIILADKFAIVSPSDNTMTGSPFTVVTSPTTINGVAVPAGIYVTAAFISNGTITNAKIGNAAIDDAKIASLSAGKITTGTLDTSRLNIDGATLTSVGGVLKVGTLSVSNLYAGMITADYIESEGINVISTFYAGSVSMNASAIYDQVISSGSLNKRSGTSSKIIMEFQSVVGASGSGAYAFYVQLYCDGSLVKTFYYLMQKSFTSMASGKVVIPGLASGNHTYAVYAQANISGSGTSGVTVLETDLYITEVRR